MFGNREGIFFKLFPLETVSIKPPNFVRPDIAGRAGTPVKNIEDTPVVTCPNTGLSCPWLKDMVALKLDDEPVEHFTEAEIRRMQHTMQGYKCLQPKIDSKTMDSECYGSMARQLEVSINIVQDRHKA